MAPVPIFCGIKLPLAKMLNCFLKISMLRSNVFKHNFPTLAGVYIERSRNTQKLIFRNLQNL
jgi:hypothetical protein